jgi:hypothetical protein
MSRWICFGLWPFSIHREAQACRRGVQAVLRDLTHQWFASIVDDGLAGVIQEYYEALKVVPGTSNPDPELEDLFGNRENDARYELTSTTPTTIAGLLALLAYIEGVTDGPCSPNGKPDIAFEQDLMNVVVGARECLQANLGFEAR